jgi:hypothetical protein
MEFDKNEQKKRSDKIFHSCERGSINWRSCVKQQIRDHSMLDVQNVASKFWFKRFEFQVPFCQIRAQWVETVPKLQ